MKTLSVLVMTAALVAAGATAQGISDQTRAQTLDSATPDRSDVKRSTKAKERTRGSSSFASAPAERNRARSSAFDGDWSVLIQTRVGDCTPTYRYGVQIQNGEVFNGGGEQVALEGHVASNGAVQVSVAAGGQEAHGAGRLTQTSGGGTWRGQGSAGACAGTWVAERRE